MSLTLADLDTWDPDAIHSVFQAATDRATGVRDAAGQIGDVIASTPWVGDSHDAAVAATGRVRADLLDHGAECDAVARAAALAETEVREIRAEWTRLQRMADRWGISIDVASGELSYLPPADPDDAAEMERRMDILEAEIADLLARTADADENLAAAIRVAAGLDSLDGLNAELADNPPVTMDAEQGSADVQELYTSGTLSPEAQARLSAATTLTPEQQAALEQGDLVLPREQMEYLAGLSRGLGGKTTEELRRLTAAPGGDKLTSAMRLATNQHVSGDAAGRGAAVRGELANAPAALREVLQDPVSRVSEDTWKWQLANGGHGFDPRSMFTDWAGMKDLAAILNHGDPALMRGSDLDVGLLGKSEEALRLMHTGTWGDTAPFADDMTTDLQTMLGVAGRDPVAVHDALVSYDATGKPVYDNEFLGNLMTHQWTDGSTAVANMLTGIPDTAVMSDPADSSQLAVATRAGETTHAFAQYAADHRDQLLDIPGTGGKSLGEVSPDLTRALAAASVPYIDDMLEHNRDDTAGFAELDDFNDPGKTRMRDFFGVIDTDDFAAHTLNTAAYAEMNQYQEDFARHVGGDTEYSALKSAGALQGVVDVGANIAANDAIADQNAAAQQAYEHKKLWYDAATRMPQFGDIVDKVGKVPGADSVLEELVLGKAPVPIDAESVTLLNDAGLRHTLANKLLRLGAGDTSVLTDAGVVSPDGGIVAYDSGAVTDTAISDAIDRYLDSIGWTTNTALDGYNDRYSKVVEQHYLERE
ncbi:hypothetical protein [Mycobacterium sp. GA-2829]|uniref:TPR repeat region-containing protein n=1 Tax=Mycobacterium sp. GA-2829 TaxID=1772283 RepID=UPI000AA45E3D|nr:hypothetical protein [Mycobacterium sp. GA-2829]